MIRREALLLMLAAPLGAMRDAEPSAARIGRLSAGAWLDRADLMMYDVGDVHALHYAEICCAHGALRLARAVRDKALSERVAARYARVIAANLPNTRNHVDANVFGVWPLELGDRAAGLGFADGQWAETAPDGLTKQARYWIDDIWMIGALQLAAWRATRRRVYLDRAALMARLYVAKLQQPNGLFHHGPDAPFFWGRGNGWVAAGLAEILSELPRSHPDYPPVLAGYRKMMAALLAHQAEDGMWRQLIDHPEAWKETSGTAMFGFAMALGARRGLLTGPAYAAAARKAWTALRSYVGEDGKLSNVCVGTGQSQDAAYYLGRPTVTGDLHGQAGLLWFAAEMVG
ncbi:glycoside hydrolase family 88 protein [Sphingomonas sp. LB-2]|uniref:glycoside hydrolase family 88/105 protein n=1 Tax=Sphingomonas caeni TaxID=2984949 RepID=UPI002230CADE|nr:glycoside hydrolase family 88 protein [Sphingomonas caeni]MCW3848933.1 glycoside hydrolase family 88 protein [Sphingomonas caeni]